MKYDLFLSYSTEEKETLARPLAVELKKLGYSVWFDPLIMSVGDSIKEYIDEGIINSDCSVILISKSYLTKQWTNYELNWFAGIEKLQSGYKIIPVWHNISPNEIDSFLETNKSEQYSSLPEMVIYLVKDLMGKRYINTDLGISGVIAKIVDEVPIKSSVDETESTISEKDAKNLIRTSYTIELYNEWHWKNFKKSIEYVKNWVSKLASNKEPINSLSEIEDIGGELEYHVFEIIHFYEKWALLDKSGVIDSTQLTKLIKNYSKYFEDNLLRPLMETTTTKEKNTDFKNLLQLIEKEVLNKQ